MSLRYSLLTAPVDLNHPGRYLHWGVLQISLANLLVVGVMLVLLTAALVLPFPKGRDPR